MWIYDRVPLEVVFWSLRNRGVPDSLIGVIEDMFADARTDEALPYDFQVPRTGTVPVSFRRGHGCCV